MSNVTIRIPTPLRPMANNADEISLEGNTVKEVLDQLVSQYDGLSSSLYNDEKELRHFVNIFIGETNIKDLQGLTTEVKDGDIVSIIPAVAGG